MKVRLVIAFVFLFVSVMAFGAEVLTSFRAGHYRFLSLAELWAVADAEGLESAQAAMGGIPLLWDPVALTVLSLPAWFWPLMLALIFFLLTYLRPARGKRRMFR